MRRSSGNVSRRYFLAAVVALFLARVLAADRLVPPWQGPDEPTHFSLTKLLASRTEVSAAERDALEARILESMARHGWWTAYQEPTPSPLPRTFREVRGYLADNVSRGSFLQPAYYAAGAVVLRVAPAMSVDAEYEVLRLLSVTLAVATLLCAWAGTRLLFGDSVAAAVIALAALHPQFLLSALTVNPDALINLCGAIVWWQGARVYAGVGHPIGALLAVATAAVVAALSKRNGIPLIIVAVGISAIAAYRWYAGAPPRQRRWLLGAAAFGIVASGIALLLAGGAQASGQFIDILARGIVIRRAPADFWVSDVIGFLKTSIDSAWLVAGWLRFPAPEWWLWAARLLTMAGLAGSLVWWMRSQTRRPLSFVWMFALLHALPLLVVAFLLLSVPQGRYLFGAFVPFAALIVAGLLAWFPARLRPAATVGLVGFVALLDIAGFTTVLVPAYT